MKEKVSDFFKGIAIGISNIVPGFSGGTMAFLLHVYEKFIDAFSLLLSHPIKAIKNTWSLLLGVLAGLISGVLIIVKLLNAFPVITAFFFTGLVISGVIDCVIHLINLKTVELKYLIPFAISLTIVIILPFISRSFNVEFSILILIVMFLLGIICSSTMVIPGISGSLVLLAFGMYPFLMENLDTIIHAFTSLSFSGTLSALFIVLSFAVGCLLGLVYASKFIKKAFAKSPKAVYSAVLGLLLASPFTIFYTIFNSEEYVKKISNSNAFTYIIGVLFLLLATTLVSLTPLIISKKGNNTTQSE